MKVLALTEDGRLTYCTCSPEQRGKGRCNHISHQEERESPEEFVARINQISNEIQKDNVQNKKEEEKKNILKLPFNQKMEMVKNNENLEILCLDKEISIRSEIAKQGYFLDKFVNDEYWAIEKLLLKKAMVLKSLLTMKIIMLE